MTLGPSAREEQAAGGFLAVKQAPPARPQDRFIVSPTAFPKEIHPCGYPHCSEF
jgi:hypothetical protein